MARTPSAFGHLPAAIRVLLPEIETLDWPEERLADCDHCPMIGDAAPQPWAFAADARCCTYHPSVVNFLAGRALRRGDPGRARILARLADPDGVTAWGIDAPESGARRYSDAGEASFGIDTSLRCPFWIGGVQACGIWHDRGATCRTWYCRHEAGLAGAVAWRQAQSLLFAVESRLAVWAIERGDPPREPAPAGVWAAWYERAAALVDAATPADVAAMASGVLARERAVVRDFVEVARLRRDRRMPEVLVPSVSETTRTPHGDVLVAGYSRFDAVRAPAAALDRLARLDGTVRWRDALGDGLDERLVGELYRIGALRDPDGGDDLPYEVDPPVAS
jgi:hypothetical protein